MVTALVTPSHRVLELGGRFGTTSCALARATANSGLVASVEVDHNVRAAALANRATHKCNFAFVGGSVSAETLHVTSYSSYATETGVVQDATNKSRHVVPRVSFAALEAKLGWHIDTLLIDCEGCVDTLLGPSDDGHILDGIRLILMEHDLPWRVGHGGYAAYFALFRRRGFEQIWLSADTFDSHQPWSRIMKHSAWARVQRGTTPTAAHDSLASLRRTCSNFAHERNYTRSRLHCLDPSFDDPVAVALNDSLRYGNMPAHSIEQSIKPLIGPWPHVLRLV